MFQKFIFVESDHDDGIDTWMYEHYGKKTYVKNFKKNAVSF